MIHLKFESHKMSAASDIAQRQPLIKRTLGVNSCQLSAAIIVADVIGIGILATPLAFAKVGWALGLSMLVLCMAVSVHVSCMLWRIFLENRQSRTLGEVVDAAMAKAPVWQRRAMSGFMSLCQALTMFFAVGAYTLTFGRGLGTALYKLQGCLPVWTCVASAAIFCALSSIRRLGSRQQKPLLILNVVTLAGTIIVPLGRMAAEGVVRPAGAVFLPVASSLQMTDAMSGLGLILLSLVGHFMAVEIMAEMERPEEFVKAYVGYAVPFQLVTYTTTALGAYYYRGSLVKGLLLDNIEFGGWLQLANFCLAFHMLAVAVVKGVVVCRMAHRWLAPHTLDGDSSTAWLTWVSIGLGCVSAANLVAQMIPFFDLLLQLWGATLAPLSLVAIILIFFIWKRGNCSGIGAFEKIVMLVEVVVSFLVLIYGATSSLALIVEKYRTHGHPFACHCEEMWATCGCSSDHHGMDFCAEATVPPTIPLVPPGL
jgi:amino acid permease